MKIYTPQGFSAGSPLETRIAKLSNIGSCQTITASESVVLRQDAGLICVNVTSALVTQHRGGLDRKLFTPLFGRPFIGMH